MDAISCPCAGSERRLIHPIFGPDAKQPTIGQILLMSKEALVLFFIDKASIEIYSCGREDIRTVRDSYRRHAHLCGEIENAPQRLVARDQLHGFRAVRTAVVADEEEAFISAEAAEALGVTNEDVVRIIA